MGYYEEIVPGGWGCPDTGCPERAAVAAPCLEVSKTRLDGAWSNSNHSELLWRTDQDPEPMAVHKRKCSLWYLVFGEECLQRGRLHSLPGQPAPVFPPALLIGFIPPCWSYFKTHCLQRCSAGKALPLALVTALLSLPRSCCSHSQPPPAEPIQRLDSITQEFIRII